MKGDSGRPPRRQGRGVAVAETVSRKELLVSARPRRGETPSSAKQRYCKPRLRVHGSVQRLTEAKGKQFNDGGGKPRTRALLSRPY
jgi:hypothetical protein